jgi:pyruvate-formate lyase-activating enzyme
MDIYQSTAQRCSSYTAKDNNSFINYTGGNRSCINCDNFENNHCKFDLYDDINETE